MAKPKRPMAPPPDQPVPRRDASCSLAPWAELADLPEPLRAELRSLCRMRRYRAGETVQPSGVPSDLVGIVASGILKMEKTLPDGRQHVVGLLATGDVFGRVFDGPSHFAIEAATGAEISAFPRRAFEAILARSPDLDRLMMIQFLNELDRARDWMLVLANPRVRGRLAGFVLVMCSRFPKIEGMLGQHEGQTTLRLPIGRGDLAALLGTRVESISRALHALADDGIIEILRPDLLVLRDIGALAAEAGEPDLAGEGLPGGRAAGVA
jgi:CRP/FNR family transcriptional regulator, anaerobic regulatory protein